MRDITSTCKPTGDIVSGADPKLWVEIDGERFLLKRGKEGNELAIYREYVVSRIFEKLGVPCQQVELVRYQGDVWAKCSDVGSMKQFMAINDSSLETDRSDKFYCMEDVLYKISRMGKLTISQRYDFLMFFKKVFIVDAWVGNRDRHAGNWGYLQSGEVCPVYDNGAALFPSISRYLGETSVRNLLYKIVTLEPKSSVQFRNKELVSDVVEWLKSFDIESIIDYSIKGLTENQKRFYYCQLYMRYNCVILQRDFNEVLKEIKYPDSVEELCGHLMI